MLKYEHIAQSIQEQIATGALAANEQLPTTAELCNTYGVSKITIKKAMDELARLGLVARRRGSGTFVIGAQPARDPRMQWNRATKIVGTSAQYRALGKELKTIVHEFSVIRPPERVRDALCLNEGFTYYICRARSVEDELINIEYAYLPISMVPNLTVEIAQNSIYSYITDVLGMKISSSHASLRAVHPTEEETQWSGIAPMTPLLEVEQTVYLDTGKAFEFSISRNTAASGPVRTVRSHG